MSSDTPLSRSNQAQPSSGLASPSSTGNVVFRTFCVAITGLVGAIMSWKAIELIGDVYVLPGDLAGLAHGPVPTPEQLARLTATTLAMNLKNAAIWLGTGGGITGLLFGLTICLSRRLGMSSIRMILATLFAGTVFGALAGLAGVWINTVSRQNMTAGATSPSEQITLLMHSAVWMIVGLGIGLGIALGGKWSGRSRIESMVVIGLVGMVGGCLFPIVAGLLLPAVNSSWPIPSLEPTAGRILWLTLPALLMGLAIGRNG